MSIDTPDLQALIELSEKATPGDWAADDYGDVTVNAETLAWMPDSNCDADSQFIAALVNWFRANHSTLTAPTLPGAGGGDADWLDAKFAWEALDGICRQADLCSTDLIKARNAAARVYTALAALPPQQGG